MKTPLHLVIKDIIVDALDVFAGNTDAEKFGVVNYDSPEDPVVNFELNVLTFAIDSKAIIVEFPNHNTGYFRLDNHSYYSIEVV